MYQRFRDQVNRIVQAARIAPIDADQFDGLVKAMALIRLLSQHIEHPHGIRGISRQLENHHDLVHDAERIAYLSGPSRELTQ